MFTFNAPVLTVASVKSQFTKMIDDLKLIEDREVQVAQEAERTAAVARKEAQDAIAFRTGLVNMIEGKN